MEISGHRDIVISFEGLGGAGKSTNARLFKEKLEGMGYPALVVKGLDRGVMAGALSVFKDKEPETVWVANIPKVDPGVEMLAYLATMKQLYHDVSSRVHDEETAFILIDRYVDTAFTIAAARAALNGPGYEDTIRNIHMAFLGLKPIMRWPDITVIIDTPMEVASGRSMLREGKPYSDTDRKVFRIVSGLYTLLRQEEPARFRIIDGTMSIEKEQECLLKEAEPLIDACALQQTVV